MKKHTLRLLPLLVAALAATSCHVEFSPNADYREIPVVYCLLDQDDDTTWARVEKCFLANDDIHLYGSQSEQIHFPQGYIGVRLLAHRPGGGVDTLALRDTLTTRDSGAFAYEAVPIFFSTARLDSTCTYHIEVFRAADDSVMAYSDPLPLLRQSDPTYITRPTNTRSFGFHDHSGGAAVCNIAWNSITYARRYQPIVRFYYGIEGDTHYVDLKGPHVTANDNRTAYPLTSFLSSLKTALQDDPRPKAYLKMVDLYVTACDENLNVYINSAGSEVTQNQTANTYTNIHGGIGIFAARRTHLYKSLAADASMNPLGSSNPGLYAYLVDLGVGF